MLTGPSPRPTSRSIAGYPKVMPRICGMVARKPKLTPELATRMLFGPGVKPIEARNGTLVSINAVGKACTYSNPTLPGSARHTMPLIGTDLRPASGRDKRPLPMSR